MAKILQTTLILSLLALACDDAPTRSSLPGFTPPSNFELQIQLLDLERPELAPVAEAVAAGDSSAAVAALIAHFGERDYGWIPHTGSADPVGEADAILAGRLLIPGHPETTLPADPTWAEDPFGDVNWRFQYHAFRWPMALLLAYEETGDPRYLDTLLFLLQDYARDNLEAGPASTETWNDMGSAFRVENWLYIGQRLFILELMDAQLLMDYLSWIHTHGRMLGESIPYAAENNHGIFHNRSLMAIGLALPEFRASAGWLELGRIRVEEQIRNLVSEAGVYLEAAPFYHYYMLGTFNSVRRLLRGMDLDFTGSALERFTNMPIFAAHVLSPRGSLPMIGDTRLWLQTQSYLGLDALLDYSISQGEQGTPPAETCVSFPVSGYALFRSGWGEQRPFAAETFATFDTGPKGGWHGHHDGLSFTLASRSEDLIVDPGYYSFDGLWFNWFRSPEAHNVLVPAEGSGPLRYEPQRLVWRREPGWAFQSGWIPLKGSRDWARHFVFLEPDDILLLDVSYGQTPEAVDFLLHFPPGASVSLESDRLHLIQGLARADIHFLDSVEMEVLSGAQDPIQGWYSHSYGNREPSPTLRARKSGEVVRFSTLIHTHDGGDPLQGFTLEANEGDAYFRFLIERDGGAERVEVWPLTGRVIRSPAN